MLPIIAWGWLIADGFDFGQWCLDILHRVSTDDAGQMKALLALVALCLCKIAFGRKCPPQRSRATLDLPEGEAGYIQIGEDEEDEEAPK